MIITLDIDTFKRNCKINKYVCTEDNQGILVENTVLKTKTHFTIDAINKYNWNKLTRHITQGKDITHVSRVVGYYSRIHNWNKSKIGELKDRHKGKYSVLKEG